MEFQYVIKYVSNTLQVYLTKICISKIQNARNTQDIVLSVNMDSPRYHQVIIGNVRYENTAAIKRSYVGRSGAIVRDTCCAPFDEQNGACR